MNGRYDLAAALRRDRRVVATGLLVLAALTWAYTVDGAWRMEGMHATMGMHGWQPWSAAEFARMFVMWTVMMAAMMLPAVAAMVLAFAGIQRRRRNAAGYGATALFLAGYLAVWTGYSLLATAAQWGLHERMLLSPMMASASPWLGGGLLVLAGVFQFTPLKRSCLHHCSNPTGFLHGGWREGAWGSVMMGVHHGVYCAGCCWALMVLMFVGGVMNLAWMVGITLLVLLERVLPGGQWLARAAGLVLLGWGGWVALLAL